MPVCQRCGEDNPERARFCLGCAAPLTAPPVVRREERKRVSVLFCDLVGFTSRAERLDVEDVRSLLSPYYVRLRDDLERYGGTVEKFIGDAVMALFGAPTAHEDDPERAVRAALSIRNAIADQSRADPSLDLHVRIGVTTGLALVSLDARPAEGEGMASGDVVSTAARQQAAAPVDGILVDAATVRATDRQLVFQPAEPVAAKGKAEPVPVWLVMQARASLGVEVDQAPVTALVGRERELELLRAALARARGEDTLCWVGFLALFRGFSQIMLAFSIRYAGEEAAAIDPGRARADQTDLQGRRRQRGDVNRHQQLQRRCPLAASRPRDHATSRPRNVGTTRCRNVPLLAV